jgi:hypothetical protein
MSRASIEQHVKKAVWSQPMSDLHTHSYPPTFGATPASFPPPNCPTRSSGA